MQKRFCEKWKHELEFIAVFAAVIYAILTYLEWNTFDSERQTMENEFQSSKTASSNELAVLQRQVDEMKQENELSERAWVTTYGLKVDNQTTKTNVSFDITIKNTGKTPAVKVTEWHDLQESIPDIFSNATQSASSVMIAPDQELFLSTSLITTNGSSVLNQFNKPYYFFGKINYDDLFCKHHWTEFCIKIEPGMLATPERFHNACDDVETNQTNRP